MNDVPFHAKLLTFIDCLELAKHAQQDFWDNWDSEAVQSSMAHGAEAWGWWSGPTLLGYMLLQQTEKEVDILNVCVFAPYQRQGHARALWNAVLEVYRKRLVSHFLLEVRVGNVAALSLYRSLGFVAVGTRAGYYARGEMCEDAWTMRLDLEREGDL